MQNFARAIAALVILAASPAFAQEVNSTNTATSGAVSSSQTESSAVSSPTLTASPTVTQQAGAVSSPQNTQGVSLTFNSEQRKRTFVGTNTPVYLAASSSFSSDFCGSTVSGGASVAPIGVSIGASGSKMDKSCQSLRRAEKFGMAAANAQNMGYPEVAGRLMSMMIWSICTAESAGPALTTPTASACDKLGLFGPMPPQQPKPAYVPPAAPVPSELELEAIEKKKADEENDPPVMGHNAAPSNDNDAVNDPRHVAAVH